MSKRNLCLPIMALFFISFGGLLLHVRIHPPSADAENWIPAVFGVVTTFVLPLMFYCRKTAGWAYLITWLAVVVGTLTMAWHSIEHPQHTHLYHAGRHNDSLRQDPAGTHDFEMVEDTPQGGAGG